jgi:ribose 5-phosphate isomerase B
MMRIGIAADHGGFELKEYLVWMLSEVGYKVADFGFYHHNLDDDYSDFVVSMARAVARGEVIRGLAICDSGVGAVRRHQQGAGRACLIRTEQVQRFHQSAGDVRWSACHLAIHQRRDQC